MRRALMMLALLSGTAHGAVCTKIEYAEARDWPVERLEQSYCQDIRRAAIERTHLKEAGTLLTARERASVTAEASTCYDQAAMFGRVLQDRHGRPPPNC